jgi:hypothetical protein
MSNFLHSFQPRGSHPPKSNTERQREFRRRHPDYYRLLQAKRRARSKAWLAAYRLAQRAEAAEAMAAVQPEPLALPAPILTIPIPTRLALPAPVEQLEIAAIERLKAMHAARVLVERSRAA